MSNQSLNVIIGVDGYNPIYNENEAWKIWNINEIYLGGVGSKKYIPNVGHMVVEIVGAKVTRYIVKSINWTNGIAELVKEESSASNTTFTETDVLVGLNGSNGLNTYLCYVDKTHTPYRLTVDHRLYVPGSMVTKCKLFRGNLLTSDGEVVSRSFDVNGALSSDSIDMEKAGVIQISDSPVVENITIKTIKPAYTTTNLKSGEFLTAVFYSQEGFVVSKHQLVVEETSFIEPPEASVLYITGIYLRSPFIQNSQDRVIRYPLNVPLAGLNLIGVVTYSDGSSRDFPVDGTRFKVMGFDNYVSTQPGQRFKVVVSYAVGIGERTDRAVVGGNETTIPLEYEVITQPVDGSYGVKLYCYPVWQDSVRGYALQWLLYNLNREISIDVTPYVVINTAITPYDPIGYGRLQNLSVSINLSRVSSRFKDYIHTQTVGLVIERQGTERLTNWSLSYTQGQTPLFGPGLYAGAYFVSTGRYRINLKSDCTNYTDWIERVYKATKPLTNPSSEVSPPTPTHFQIVVGGVQVEYPIEQWDQNLYMTREVTNSSTLLVKFIRRIANSATLELACAGLPVYYVNQNGDILI